jgi:nicotinamidase-related amidase
VLAPIIEELMFRGILLPWLRQAVGPWPAILLSSAIFAIAHLDAWPAPFALFVLALFLGYLAYRTTSLVAPIVLHSVFNAANLTILILALTLDSEPGGTQAMRSPELMGRTDSGLLVIDVQTKLMDKMPDRDRVVANMVRLVEGARVLGIPVQATEQYPKGIGPTVAELADRLPARPEKLTFSCCGLAEVAEQFRERGVGKILLAGIETHVCVQQTALDLVAVGFRAYVAADAVASRKELDRELGLRRMERAGVVLTTTEAALFEWTERAGTAEFKQISRLVTSADADVLRERV